MPRIGSLLLVILAVAAAGAVGVSSASAETCTGGSHWVACTWPGNVPIVHELALGLGGLSVLAGTIGGAEVKAHCPDAHSHGELTLLGEGSGAFVFLGCKLEKPAGCKLSAAQEKEVEAQFTTKQESATLATLSGSGPGEEFLNVTIESMPGETCVSTGQFSVTGKQMVESPTGGEGKVEQEVVAKKSESLLKVGGNSMSLSSKGEVHLGGANKGSAWLGMAGE